MDRRVTSPTWGPPPSCKQALKTIIYSYFEKGRRKKCARDNPKR